MPLQAVDNRRLYRQIADQIAALIEKGEYGAGQRLPPERDLARQLGVSRPSVREALIALEVEGYVEVRVGCASTGWVAHRCAPAPLPPTRGRSAHQAALAIEANARRSGAGRHENADPRMETARPMDNRAGGGVMPRRRPGLHLRSRASAKAAGAVGDAMDQRTGPLSWRLEHHF